MSTISDEHLHDPKSFPNHPVQSEHYDDAFFKGLQIQAENSAARLIPLILEFVQPHSVIDIGCGSGNFLAALRTFGIEDIMGIDGAYAQKTLVIPGQNFQALDLSHPFTLDRTYDLALCLEVAEHLPPESAENFVTSLTRLAPVILFSAAIPYQGGTSHINEQWPEYWAKLFKEQGYVAVDALRPRIWHDEAIAYWYRQNMLFFCREDVLASNEKMAAAHQMTYPDSLSRIHPRLYLEHNTKSQRLFRRLLRQWGRVLGGKHTNPFQ